MLNQYYIVFGVIIVNISKSTGYRVSDGEKLPSSISSVIVMVGVWAIACDPITETTNNGDNTY